MKKSKSLKKGGVKFDDGKLRADLMPVWGLLNQMFVYTMGACKYADRNWEKGMAWGRVWAAMIRHAFMWWIGESHDPDGQHHLSSVAWCANTLMEFEITHPEFDDRPKYPSTFIKIVRNQLEKWSEFLKERSEKFRKQKEEYEKKNCKPRRRKQ